MARPLDEQWQAGKGILWGEHEANSHATVVQTDEAVAPRLSLVGQNVHTDQRRQWVAGLDRRRQSRRYQDQIDQWRREQDSMYVIGYTIVLAIGMVMGMAVLWWAQWVG